MSTKRPPWQLQAMAAHKRELELQRAEQRQKVADYFENNTRSSRHHEQWTAEGYYEKANREAELLSQRKIRAAKLEERRKKLELMLFQENMQYQQELKCLDAKPKLFKNGSYLNNVPTSTLSDINDGIMAKEEQLRRHEAELRLYHAWRASQPELRAAESYIRSGKLKSAWMEQIVEKEVQKKKDEEETRRILLERDESLRRQIVMEEEKLKEKELQIKELRNSLEGQISELSEKESVVKELRKQEEKQKLLLDELNFIREEREREHKRLVSERETNIVNMGLHKYKLKLKVLAVVKEIEVDLNMLERLKQAIVKDQKEKEDRCEHQKRVIESAMQQMRDHKERERQRHKNIEDMYDGEARQINEKQDRQWEKERKARAILMEEVLSALQKQVEEKIEASRRQQKQNVLEREQILDQVDSFHKEVCDKEKEKQFQNTTYGSINTLQSQLNSLKLQQKQLEEKAAAEASVREALVQEEKLRRELVKMHREGVGDLPSRRRVAW